MRDDSFFHSLMGAIVASGIIITTAAIFYRQLELEVSSGKPVEINDVYYSCTELRWKK